MQELKPMKLKIIIKQKIHTRGFILPLTLLVCSIILIISSGISTVLSKELYFSRISRESQLAYYAADDAMMCILMIDNQYIDPATGQGIFPYDSVADPINSMQLTLNKVNLVRQSRGLNQLNLNDIKCATVPVFNQLDQNSGGSDFKVDATPFSHTFFGGQTETGRLSTLSMKMDLGNGTYRCAKVKVYKTAKYRQIIVRGFTSCDNSRQPIERAIINTTEVK